MIQLDLNNPAFQANLSTLNKPDAWAVFKTLKRLQAMSWEQIQASKGLRWELILWDTNKPDGTPKKQLDVSRLAALGWWARIPLPEGLVGTVADFRMGLSSGAVRLG